MVAVGAQALDHRPSQHAEQQTAIDRPLRPAVAGGETARFGPDPLSLAVVVGERTGAHRQRVQLGRESELGQLARGVGQHVDADPELAHLPRRLEQLDVVDASGPQRQRERTPPDATAHDRHLHAITTSPAV